MSTFKKVISIGLIVLAAAASVVQNIVMAPDGIDNLVDIAAAPEGKTLVAQVEDGDVLLNLVNEKGVIGKHVKFAQTKKGLTSVIADIAVDDNNRAYVIRDYMDAKTGQYLRQDLEVYEMDRLFGKRQGVHPLENENGIRYRWVSISSVAILMGTNSQETVLQRDAYDLESLGGKGAVVAKGSRTYEINPRESIYEAVPAATDVAYMTRSGKVFRAEENAAPQEVYPARELQRLMYPMFLIPVDGETVMIGEQERGDICLLNIHNGATQITMEGGERFSGVSDYVAHDILRMSARDSLNYTGVMKNQATGTYDLLVCQRGTYKIIDNITPGIVAVVFSVLGWFLLYLLIVSLIYGLITAIVNQVRESRTILLKLAFSAIPLLIAAFVLFGFFSYRSYSDSIEGSFRKQVEDEGNLLTALFGTESFNEIEFPYDYTTEGYSYLIQQMDTREVYTRTAYYENNQFYTGVDKDLPCFYPFDMVTDSDTVALYEQAAYTGIAQTGLIEDRLGRRISCVTPIGGIDGGTVYLLETGMFTSNMDAYTSQFLWRYVLVAALFTLVISILLMAVFMRILDPLTEIKNGLESFARGDRKVRMESSTQDELSDIARVFNKMANDIDTQLYTLKSISETYYRFVPQRIFRLMGKENLGELQLGNHIEGRYNILCAELKINPDRMDEEAAQAHINRFFNILSKISGEYDASLVVDSVNLCSLKVICPEDGERGVNIALSALAQIDSYNATVELQNRMDVMFILHRTEIYYGICGDEDRYIPAMVSMELESLADRIPMLQQFTSRLIVTQAAYDTIDAKNYYSRFIGLLNDSRFKDLGLYDFYDENSPEVIRLINNTKSTFDKAIELYLQKRYYDAKNLFAIVLRENQYDNVARYYIFRCEKKL